MVSNLWGASGGEYLAVTRGTTTPGGTDVPNGLLELRDTRYGGATATAATRPMASMHPADLATAATAERRAANPDVKELLGLLRACLEYRFGTAATPGAGEPIARAPRADGGKHSKKE